MLDTIAEERNEELEESKLPAELNPEEEKKEPARSSVASSMSLSMLIEAQSNKA